MDEVTVTCDRCGKQIRGLRTEDMTAGFYDTSGHTWGQYANDGELVVCDDCMWSDPRYIAVYGDNRPKPMNKE